MAEEFSGVKGVRRADHHAQAQFSTPEVTIRGSKELLSQRSCLTAQQQPLPVCYTSRQVKGDQGSLFREL